MIYSYTQISQYLCCPRRYRYRYLDGWQEKDTRAALLFGGAFESALVALYRGDDCGITLYNAWAPYQDVALQYPRNDNWGRLFEQGIHMLERYAQQDRVHVVDPVGDLQVKMSAPLSHDNEFVAYLDAIAELDGVKTIVDWKTTSARYVEEPGGIVALDPQLICYSWLTGIDQVALVVFVRKNSPEIQYLKASIRQEQRDDYERLVRTTIAQIEAASFPMHTGIRIPQNACTSCSCLGLCLGRPEIIDANLVRDSRTNHAWIDELHY